MAIEENEGRTKWPRQADMASREENSPQMARRRGMERALRKSEKKIVEPTVKMKAAKLVELPQVAS
jgi:hypothetical protein